jgi:hypothetical protein
MIKVLLLIFEPVMTWGKIAQAKWKALTVLTLFLIPLLALTLAGELCGLWRWGKAGEYLGAPSEVGGRVRVSQQLLISYGVAQFLASVLMVAIGAGLMKSFARTFCSRHTYTQCFTVTAYSFGPLFLARLCDALPAMNPWATFGIGIAFTIAILYRGIPWVLDPDPPHAFGLYLCSVLILGCLGALMRYLTLLVLAQKVHF